MSFPFTAEKLVFGGEALGHDQGSTVLVPRALPGERLEVEERSTAKGVVHARPLRVITPAAERIDPPCPYFGRCGGCQYQHFSAENQLAAKREILRETLRRIGKIDWKSEIPAHASPPWNYRNQAEFKVVLQPGCGTALGFFEAESHSLCPIDACLIISPRLNEILTRLQMPEWTRRLAGCSEIKLLSDHRDDRVMVTLHGRAGAVRDDSLPQDCLARLPGVVSVAAGAGDHWRTRGASVLEYRVGDFNYRISPTSFFQTSRFLLPRLVEAATSAEGGKLALDLFAGVGLLTLPLARRFGEVLAVEAHEPAARDLAANAQAHDLTNVRAAAATAYDFLRRFARTQPDLVLRDPPRAGVGARTLKLMVALRPRRIHYLSCHPPTLARDLEFLGGQGFILQSIEMFDCFPQTFHIESLAKLAPSR